MTSEILTSYYYGVFHYYYSIQRTFICHTIHSIQQSLKNLFDFFVQMTTLNVLITVSAKRFSISHTFVFN